MPKHVPPLTQFTICLPFTFLMARLFGFQLEKFWSWVCSKKYVCFDFAFLTCCLVIAIRLYVSEDLPCMGTGGICPLIQVECTSIAWCCLTFYYLKRCMMRQLDLFNTLWWCNIIIIINFLIVWRIFKYYSVLGGTSCVFISKKWRHGWALFDINYVCSFWGGRTTVGWLWYFKL